MATPSGRRCQIDVFGFLLLKGSARDYLLANLEVLRNLSPILKKRRVIQRTRKLPDRLILHSALMNMRGDLLSHSLLAKIKRVLGGFFSAYWMLVRRLV